MKLISYAALSLLLMTATLESSSQNCTCIPNDSLKIAAALIQEGRFVKLELMAKDSALTKALKTIDTRNKTIANQRKQITNLTAQVKNGEAQNKLLTQQRDIASGNVDGYKKEIKKMKTGRWIERAGWVAGVFLTAYIVTR